MLLIRRFEEAAAKAYALGKIKGFCHLYIGQEAVAVGAMGALEKQDYVVSTYRDHGHALARGLSARECMAELYGKVTGCSKGLGGSMHFFDRARHFMGGHGIVGGHIPIACGIAFGSRYKRERAVTLCFMGDGAVNIGGFHEGLTFAALWNLPVVFIVENNLYSMGTPLYRHLPLEDISVKGKSYGMHSVRVETYDVWEFHEVVREAVNRARSQNEPTLIEAVTYRYRGHSMSDPAKYRPPSELERKKELDAIELCAKTLLEEGIPTTELEEIQKKVKEIVDDAVAFAESSDFPPVSLLHQYTYVNP
ncbi:MAG: pyruvate dehydrogenase (acetyl-transferring) E1 component subunit alpha [Leptospiraceae bacterium]|nr:pyruvate dehydrogenase (acetyl-transferring) E1 component subunit alpha [Leptospiraceae bacterium]MDW8307403.1 pyruvate dehydrogenase (acetyl-transferring) E1 component subunit alpha [Leptospiraceae bacterium]